MFENLDVHPNATVPLEVSFEQDDLGKKLVFTFTRTATTPRYGSPCTGWGVALHLPGGLEVTPSW